MTERLGEWGAKPLALALLLAAGGTFAVAQEGPRARGNDNQMSDRAVSQTGPSASPRSDPPQASARSGGGDRGSGGDHGGRVDRGGGGHGGHGYRGHRGYRGHHGHRYGHRHYGYYGGHRYYPGWWGSVWFGYPYPYYYPYGYGYGYPYGHDRYRSDRYGALDLDVNPGRTEVFLDGQYIGNTDSFDGFPEYLWLEKGTYDVAFYLDGHRTVARQITVYPGITVDVNFRMEPGESVRPEELVSKSHERRDARLKQDEEMRERAERGEQPGYDDDWRERNRGGNDDYDDEGRVDARGETGRLILEIEPDDASVYLDGRFLGTGEDLANRSSGLRLDPGEHVIAVVRPGRKSEEQRFTVRAGQEVEIEIELDSE